MTALRRLRVEVLCRTISSEEDTSAVTQPDTLRAVLRYVKAYSPRQLVVSGGARISGMMDVVKQERAEYVDHNRPPFVSLDCAEPTEGSPDCNRHTRIEEYRYVVPGGDLLRAPAQQQKAR